MNQKLIKSIKSDVYEHIHTNIPARIISFNHVEMSATIQIIAKLKIRGIEQVPKYVYRVPVGHNRSKTFGERNPLQKDDIVFLSFSEVDLEKILTTGLPESILGDERFNLNDAVIITCISLKNQKMPEENQNDWCLFNFQTGHKIIFKEDGVYEISAKKLIANVDEEINLNTKIVSINAISKVDIVTKNINIDSTTGININTPIINALNSDFNILNIKAVSLIVNTLNTTISAIIKGIDFLLHKHSGVQNGSGETGGPK